MPEQIIGSPTQHMMAVNNSGAVPIAAYSGGTIYPLRVNAAGELVVSTTAATVTTGSQQYIYGNSGTDWYPLLVVSGADGGVLRTSINDPSTIGSYTTQTVDATDLDIRNLSSVSDSVQSTQGTDPWITLGSTNITNFNDLGSIVVIDSPSTIGSYTTQTIDGTVGISTSPLPVSGAYFPGSNVMLESLPTDSALNNPWMALEYISSGASTGIDTGSSIGSITMFIGAGSYVKHLTYTSNNLTAIGSWS